jgi:hypothetical protein
VTWIRQILSTAFTTHQKKSLSFELEQHDPTFILIIMKDQPAG